MPTGRPLDRRAVLIGSLGLAAGLVAGCSSGRPSRSAEPDSRLSSPPASPAAPPAVTTPPPTDDPAAMAVRATVPVLCWHQLREWTSADSGYSRRFLICPPSQFRAQLDALAEDGWTAISPAQYLEHLTTGAALPARPVVLSFDDSQGSQVTQGLPKLQQRSMTGTFFCMTVVLDKPDWMSRDDLRRLADAGMTVAAHTYDHNRVDRYAEPDWPLQLDAPRQLLEEVIRQPVEHFAYPYGAFAPNAFPHLQAAGYKTAFQLSDQALDVTAPQYTLRRVLVDSTWTGGDLLQQVRGPV
jgi:peptidoglycan/xylan/chitin deacetylase (PgdA/CDA1 family)